MDKRNSKGKYYICPNFDKCRVTITQGTDDDVTARSLYRKHLMSEANQNKLKKAITK